ncbi:hypothetical protein [Photobacterium profundum]|uniref:hypothetical protein n=1 Tax=Photobacterium profundum TaxID=74109 RepID=UPI0003150211|nr:hypothetical protein [Photobacterium profundum]
MKFRTLLLSGLISGIAFSASVQAKTLKLAHALPTEHPVHQSLEWFAKQASIKY